MTFDPTKPVRTRDGKPARIIATDLKSDHPIVAAVKDKNGDEYHYGYTKNGHWIDDSYEGAIDLVNIPEKHELWVNVYDSCFGGFNLKPHATREAADNNAREARIACLHLTFEEGEGL